MEETEVPGETHAPCGPQYILLLQNIYVYKEIQLEITNGTMVFNLTLILC